MTLSRLIIAVSGCEGCDAIVELCSSEGRPKTTAFPLYINRAFAVILDYLLSPP
jgi:hypothetical protein